MFGFLKKKLGESVKKLSKKVEQKPAEKIEKPVKERLEKRPKPKTEKAEPETKAERGEPKVKAEIKKEPTEPKKSLRERLVKKITKKALSEKDVDEFFNEIEVDLLQANVAVGVAEALRSGLKEKLAGKEIKRGKADETIKNAFEEALMSILKQDPLELEKMIKDSKKEGRPALFVFLGFNGSGKTTSIAKLGSHFKSRNYKPVLAAGDTFRAAAIQQLEEHGRRLELKVVKHQYGSDSAAVIFDAVKHAESKGHDIVLADTAGRTHTNVNLLDELKKVIRVNKPDLKILVIDSLTGNDAVEQAKRFNQDIGVDAVIMTKVDVNEKGGSILSVAHSINKPILFLGVGQEYRDFEQFEPKKFVDGLFG